ncbi:MAG: hypothetical protein A2Y07_00710 [Planctomycetes bacterium GWF2_50_10]|nr:MAG: hypothetical protein A2Y07_00710 [Planctomycetes bacterium GWF2_50_10]
MTAKTHNTIDHVVRSLLCTGCGACAGICRYNAITIRENCRGLLTPVINSKLCIGCGFCFRVCPGQGFDFPAVTKQLFGGYPAHPEIGNFLSIHSGYAVKNEIRKQCQSGGIVSAVLIHALENRIIDGAVVSRWNREDPLNTEVFIARNKDEILSASGSKYSPVPTAQIIGTLKNTPGRFAFVGVSCQVHAIRNAHQMMPELSQKIVFIIGLFCQGTMSHKYLHYALAKAGICAQDVQRFAYRAKEWRGWPGDIRIVGKSGNIEHMPSSDRMCAKPYFTPWRCNLCIDKLNEFADFSVGDCRNPLQYGSKSLKEVNFKGHPGISDIIVRTKAGEGVIKMCLDAGVIELKDSSWQDLLVSAQPSRKKLEFTYFAALARILHIGVPSFNIRYIPKNKILNKKLTRYSSITIVILFHYWLIEIISGTTMYVFAIKSIPIKILAWLNRVREKGLASKNCGPEELIVCRDDEDDIC